MSVLPLDPTTKRLLQTLQSDYDVATPDADVIAQQVVYAKTRKGKPRRSGKVTRSQHHRHQLRHDDRRSGRADADDHDARPRLAAHGLGVLRR